MKGVWFKLMALVFAVLAVMLVTVISLPLPVVNYDLLAGYEDYYPGSKAYMNNPDCDYFDTYYSKGYGLYCPFEQGAIRVMIGNLREDMTISDIYLYTRKCIPVAELMLSIDVDVKVLNHHARYLSWAGGHVYAWVRRGRLYSPMACIFGIYLKKG